MPLYENCLLNLVIRGRLALDSTLGELDLYVLRQLHNDVGGDVMVVGI